MKGWLSGGGSVARRALGAAALVAAVALGVVGCREQHRTRAYPQSIAGGDPGEGRRLIAAYGCQTCHMVPGVRGPEALVGPPLVHWSRRGYIAGMLPNTPENLVVWIYDPPAINARTAMPNVGATVEEATHMAAYLFTLR
jgi:cytochrome c2